MAGKLSVSVYLIGLALFALLVHIFFIQRDNAESYSKIVLNQRQSEYESRTIPYRRGDIYDRNGVALAYQTRAYALGVVPGQVQAGYWTNLINEFSRLTGKTPQVITEMMNRAEPTEYLVIGEVTADKYEERYSYLNNYDVGVYVTEYNAGRYYTEGGIGVHMIGYVLPISAEEAEDMQRQGYRVDERIGSLGIEAWGQEYLAGKRGASLYVVDAEGNTIERLSRTEAEAAHSIYTTYDEQFEYDLQRAVNGLNAAVVVLERDTGRVLGMASAPGFDANLLDFNNYNSFFSGNLLYNNDRPMYNRATQGQYPLGSVFKIIGMAAALETGIYEITDTYECGHYWNELDGIELHDWTLDHEVAPSGTLNLSEALMRSCNPWFYKIGKELYQQVGPDALSGMARGFGLGSLTGIGELEEDGNIAGARNAVESIYKSRGVELSDANFNALLEEYREAKGTVSQLNDDEVQGLAAGLDEITNLQSRDPQALKDLGASFQQIGGVLSDLGN